MGSASRSSCATCSRPATTSPKRVGALERLPFQLAHNLTLVDAGGDLATAYLAPDRRPVITGNPVATNHQDVLDWPEYTTAVRTHEREALIAGLLSDPTLDADAFARAFLVPPLLDSAGLGHFGTLYTAVFHPTTGQVEHRWPAFTWRQSFDGFEPGEHTEASGRERLPSHSVTSVPTDQPTMPADACPTAPPRWRAPMARPIGDRAQRLGRSRARVARAPRRRCRRHRAHPRPRADQALRRVHGRRCHRLRRRAR